MKIVIINGSLRKNGATANILNEFEKTLLQYGDVDVSYFQLSDLKVEYCQGCCACYRTGRCFIKDDCETLSQAISEADGLIIGSPTYASGVSGKLKTFIDRGHFVVEQLLSGTCALSVITYENAGGNSVSQYLKNLFVLSGANNIGSLAVKVPFGENPINQNAKRISALSGRLYLAIQKKARPNIIDKLYHAIALRFALKPLVKRKGKAYQGVVEKWKKLGISSLGDKS
jgi:multimeric flavodoxin WrbA